LAASSPAVRSSLIPSSALTVAPGAWTGTISASNRPAALAAEARWWLRSANSSCLARSTPYLSATFSAVSPRLTGGYICVIFGLTSRHPSLVSARPASRGKASAARGSTNGARVMDSAPPAMQTSASPAAIARAAELMASMPEPQSRLTVAPGISTGSPASSTPIRATFLLSSPAWLAAPQ
jgi:hypothetical protein